MIPVGIQLRKQQKKHPQPRVLIPLHLLPISLLPIQKRTLISTALIICLTIEITKITFVELTVTYFHSIVMVKIKNVAVVITNPIKQNQTKSSNGKRNTLSVYESLGDRNTKREPA